MTELWDRLSTGTQEADGVRRQREAVRVMGGRKRPGPGLGKSLLVLQRVTDGGEAGTSSRLDGGH